MIQPALLCETDNQAIPQMYNTEIQRTQYSIEQKLNERKKRLTQENLQYTCKYKSIF